MISVVKLPVDDRQKADAAGAAATEARSLDTSALQSLQQALRLADLDGLLRLCQADHKGLPAACGPEALLMDRGLRETELASRSGDGVHQPLRSAGVDVRPERLM